MIGIYKITNKVNGKMYIGGSVDVERRRIEHFKPSRIKRLKHLPIYKAVDEFGREAFDFEVLAETTEENLVEREEYFIERYNAVKDGYNTVTTAHNMHDDEQKLKHSQLMTKRNNKNWQDEEYRRKMSEMNSNLQKERLKDPEYLAEKSAQLKQYTDSIKKPVGQYDKQGNLIAEFGGVREAERATGIGSSLISAVAKGKKYRKSAGGYVWKFL